MSSWTSFSETLWTGGNWIPASQGIVEPLVMIDNEQPHQELVKCVVVGDTAVGKTRLICARACNKRLSLSQLLTTHVPTVWAIDQYRMCKDVLERSWEVVDGVNVSLRLWDTFGDHEKDRRFAYGRSDVVLLCFSVTSHVSLRNCKAMWVPEIRQFCPHTPILLVGCKSDLRYMYRDDTYLSFFRDRSPFIRPIRKSDLVMPDEARAMAREFGVSYYETSVLTYYGVNEVFENAIRAALISRKNQRFWMTNLKKVQKPLLQLPYCPPKPIPPPAQVLASTYEENIQWLYHQQQHADVVFVVNNIGFTAHKFILAAASPVFQHLFSIPNEAVITTEVERSTSESSIMTNFGEATLAEFNDDTECLIVNETAKLPQQQKRCKDCPIPGSTSNFSNPRSYSYRKELNHPVFSSITIECNMSSDSCEIENCQHTVITVSKLVTPTAMSQCLQFLYTGNVEPNYNYLQDLRQAAEFMELNELLAYINNIQSKDDYLNVELRQRYKLKFRERLVKLCLEEGLYTDIIFQLDDGVFAAHRALLSSRCDVMRAMFSGNFKEKSAKIIFFPGVHSDTFQQLLMFLYTDDIKPISSTRCLDLIELANRLCLIRLINLVERAVIDELNRFSATENSDVIQPCLRLLETCKLHNADQLADWCMSYLCVNYNKLCKMSPKLLKSLHPENQEYLMEHRWPPVWYLKDSDYYMKHVNERQREDKLFLKRGSSNSRCLCFGGSNEKTSPDLSDPPPITVTWKIR
ncbi:rho-related BTB domain-containing protein 1 [Planococcus citri]|uniref:rho-related BTB domain-containing protein 1 n=1 Tax=Planococcus citri TaxID=170843 RepID=UPI0031FA3BAE